MTSHDKYKIIAAAQEAEIVFDKWGWAVGYVPVEKLYAFYAIAFEAGRQAERESINLDDGTIDWRGENEV